MCTLISHKFSMLSMQTGQNYLTNGANAVSKSYLFQIQKEKEKKTNNSEFFQYIIRFLQYNDEDNIKNMLPVLKIIVGQKIPVWIFRQEISLVTYLTEISLRSISLIIFHCSGDQDAILSILGSRSLVRELAEELKYNITVPYGAWYYKSQV